jgi:hypothetical protein
MKHINLIIMFNHEYILRNIFWKKKTVKKKVTSSSVITLHMDWFKQTIRLPLSKIKCASNNKSKNSKIRAMEPKHEGHICIRILNMYVLCIYFYINICIFTGRRACTKTESSNMPSRPITVVIKEPTYLSQWCAISKRHVNLQDPTQPIRIHCYASSTAQASTIVLISSPFHLRLFKQTQNRFCYECVILTSVVWQWP